MGGINCKLLTEEQTQWLMDNISNEDYAEIMKPIHRMVAKCKQFGMLCGGIYLLVLNWPQSSEKPEAVTLQVDEDLVNRRSLRDVYVVVASARNADYFEGQTIKGLSAEKLTLKPYQGVVLCFKP
ncbi:hypothetical protein AAVH_36936 [Aphelenchoides avenae]|nr:hypothetical protein AAVH_36936 [Aphelenchus avenae]